MMYDDLVKSLRQCTEASCAGCKNEFVEIGCRGLLEHEADCQNGIFHTTAPTAGLT